MLDESLLIALACGAIILTLINFRLSVATGARFLFPILDAIASWFGVSIAVWGFLSIRWYWVILAIVCGYVISYGIIGGSQLHGKAASLAMSVPVFDVLVIAAAAYLWIWYWPF